MLVTLKNQTMSAVIDSVGAQIISLKNGEKEYLWQRDPNFWSNCSPLLFPAIGNSRDGKTILEGTTFDLPKHGFCRTLDFQTEDQTDVFVTFCLSASELTKTMYPYDFRLSLTYTLTDDGIFMDYLVGNPDSRTIYYCLGAHPGFRCPLEEGERFEDYQLEFEQTETLSALVYNVASLQFDRSIRIPVLNDTHILPLDYHLFDRDALYFDQLQSRKVSMVHSVTGKGVEVSYPDFSSVAFWTPTNLNAPLLCVEPWNGSAICSDEDDQFIHKHDVQSLAPGESRSYHLGIRVIG